MAQKRFTISDVTHKLPEISENIPETYDSMVHGYQRRCSQLFTLLPKAGKRKISLTAADDEVPSTSRGADPLSRHRQPCVVRFFLLTKCLFCDKQYIQVYRKKQILVKCVTQSIKTAAEAKDDEKILCKVHRQDLQAREAWYHNYCRRNYTRDIGERHVTHTDSESSQSQAAHNAAFKYISKYIEDHIIWNK